MLHDKYWLLNAPISKDQTHLSMSLQGWPGRVAAERHPGASPGACHANAPLASGLGFRILEFRA